MALEDRKFDLVSALLCFVTAVAQLLLFKLHSASLSKLISKQQSFVPSAVA